MTEMKITRADMSDAQEIYALYHSLIQMAYSTWDEEYPSLAIVKDDLANHAVLIMRDEQEKIVAAIAITDDEEELECDADWYPDVTRWLALSRLGVAKEMQGKGIAKRMLLAAMEECAQHGAQAVRFLVSKTNPYPQRAYAKLNFDICGETFCYDQPWLCYQKRLESCR